MIKMIYTILLLGILLLQSSCNTHKLASTLNEKVDDSAIWDTPERQPNYLNGGMSGLLNDLYSTLLETAPISQECIKGRAVVKFKITEEGIIDSNSITILRNNNVPEDYLEAAIDAIKNLGNFEPGAMNGKPMKVWYNLPIIYPVPLDKIKAEEPRDRIKVP